MGIDTPPSPPTSRPSARPKTWRPARRSPEAATSRPSPPRPSRPSGKRPNKRPPRRPRVRESGPAAPPVDRTARQGKALKAKIEAEPTSPHSYLQLALVYRRADRFEEARKILEQGLAKTGGNFEVALELADLGIEPFRADLALTDQKLRADPDDEELRRLRAGLVKEITRANWSCAAARPSAIRRK